MVGTLKVGVILLLIMPIQSVIGLVIMGYSAGSDNSPIEITIVAKTRFIAGKMGAVLRNILVADHYVVRKSRFDYFVSMFYIKQFDFVIRYDRESHVNNWHQLEPMSDLLLV
jgi:uncharacterized membrane protein YhhN